MGNQVLNGNQNKTLNESQTNGIGVHLFEVFRDGAYTYQGQVELANDPYREKQLDSKEQIRDVWIFPVRLKSGGSLTTIPNEDYQRVQQSRRRKISKLSDDELKNKTAYFKDLLVNGSSLEKILPESFATIREVSKRVLNLRHFDVQLLGGIILHRGMIAEMKTGEGKTLVATLAAYLNALNSDPVHIVTVNDYLAKNADH